MDNKPPGGIDVICFTCNETERFPYQSIKDAREYDRFLNDCVRDFSARHSCIDVGSTIRVSAYSA